MNPEQKCDRRRCGHELKWHNPCSKCKCHAFMTPMDGATSSKKGK